MKSSDRGAHSHWWILSDNLWWSPMVSSGGVAGDGGQRTNLAATSSDSRCRQQAASCTAFILCRHGSLCPTTTQPRKPACRLCITKPQNDHSIHIFYFSPLSRLSCLGKQSMKISFLGLNPKPVDAAPLLPPLLLGTFRNRNVNFCQKKSGFQGQKQWPPNFHIKFRNTNHSHF